MSSSGVGGYGVHRGGVVRALAECAADDTHGDHRDQGCDAAVDQERGDHQGAGRNPRREEELARAENCALEGLGQDPRERIDHGAAGEEAQGTRTAA